MGNTSLADEGPDIDADGFTEGLPSYNYDSAALIADDDDVIDIHNAPAARSGLDGFIDGAVPRRGRKSTIQSAANRLSMQMRFESLGQAEEEGNNLLALLRARRG